MKVRSTSGGVLASPPPRPRRRVSARVALISVFGHRNCTLKDVAGGYGTVFEVGDGWRARLLERAKGRLARLPPLVLGYLSAQLREAAHDVEVHALRPRDPLPACDVAIVLSSIVDHDDELRVCERLRERGVHTVVVGAYASARPERYAGVADAVVVGEPEALGPGLLEARGHVQAGDVEDLDELPFPDWAPFPVASYRYAFLSSRSPTLPVGSARGCAFGCGYCPWRVTARFRERTPRSVALEIKQLRDRHGVRGIAFRDPLFNLDRDRVTELADRIAPLGIRFSAEMRADRLDEPLLRRLQGAGLRSLEIGVESVNRSMLTEAKRRPPEKRQIENVVRTAQRLGIRVICNYMIGLPADDEATIRQTVAWAKELDSFAVQFTVATPYPGTTLEPAAAGKRLPLAIPTGFTPTFEHPRLTTRQIEDLREWAYVSYHFRPRYLWRFIRHAAPALVGV